MDNITLAEFQIRAISELMKAMEDSNRDIVLKSCTGSGKTIILTHFMDEYFKSYPQTIFVWLTPGKGSLEEQSKEKMDKYIHGSNTKLLSDIMTSGFEENDACFINWEKLTKKGNNALKDSERTNFFEHIEKAHRDGLHFNIIVDESHQNQTIKADAIMQYFKADKIIRCSATPTDIKQATLINIPEADVIAEGLIKKMLIINENFANNVVVDNEIEYLLEKAFEKQRELHATFLKNSAEINPLILVQIPNKNDVLQDEIERWFEKQGVTYENGQLACWLSDKHENIEDITNKNANSVAVIIKQAIATGWDCPRAHILVKLRDNMSETFEIQTIGRIRRMPEARHYENDALDSCYLYTLDEKFTEGVKLNLGNGALSAAKLFLKNEYKSIELTCLQRSGIAVTRDSKRALMAVAQYFADKFGTGSNLQENQKRLLANGFFFDVDIVRSTKSGEVATLESKVGERLNDVTFRIQLNTHEHGREYHHAVAKMGLDITLEYAQMNTIIRKLFVAGSNYSKKILSLTNREIYSFVLNNEWLLKDSIRSAMAHEMNQMNLQFNRIVPKKFIIPQECLFTYDANAKLQSTMDKNVYNGYLSSAEVRSAPEKLFEKFCEQNGKVTWWYKNGDKGNEYFSLVYEDNFGKEKMFYPDYLVGIGSDTWIIETKGGFSQSGESQDIDIYSAKKFTVLKQYLEKYHMKGGFVRQDKHSQVLCICTEEYNDDINSQNWTVLEQTL